MTPTTGRAITLTVYHRDGSLVRIAFVPTIAVMMCDACGEWYTDRAAMIALDAEARARLDACLTA